MTTKFTRKVNRLPFKQIYQSNNSFFVTICVQDRIEIFDICSNDNFVNCIAKSTQNGDAVVASTQITKLCADSLLNISLIYENIELGNWVIMPNHIHFIVHFLDTPKSKFSGKKSNLGSITKSFKLHFQKAIVEATTASPFQNSEPQLLQSYFIGKKF